METNKSDSSNAVVSVLYLSVDKRTTYVVVLSHGKRKHTKS